jgi:hypothetical protein
MFIIPAYLRDGNQVVKDGKVRSGARKITMGTTAKVGARVTPVEAEGLEAFLDE